MTNQSGENEVVESKQELTQFISKQISGILGNIYPEIISLEQSLKLVSKIFEKTRTSKILRRKLCVKNGQYININEVI